MSRKALYFRDSHDRHYDRAYVDGLDVSKELCGYFFDIVIENGDIVLNEAGTINVDHEDESYLLKEGDIIPTMIQPTKKQYKKVTEFASKIGQRADGFQIRRSSTQNRMFTSVNIVYDKNDVKTSIIKQNPSDKATSFIDQKQVYQQDKQKIIEITL